MSTKYYATLNHRKARVLGYLPGRPVFQPCVAAEISEEAFNDPLTQSLAKTGELSLHKEDVITVVSSPVVPAKVVELKIDITASKVDEPAVETVALKEESKPEVVKEEQSTQVKRNKKK